MAVAATYITSILDASDLTVYDFGNVTVPVDGLAVVAVLGRATTSRTISSVSIGGSAGVIWVNNGNVANPCGIAGRVVTAGAHNITVTFSGALVRSAIGVWVVTGYASTIPAATDNKYATTGNAPTITLDFGTTGAAIYGVIWLANEGATWSNAAERFGATFTDSGTRVAGADRTASGSGVVETASWTTSAIHGMVGAVWYSPAGVPRHAIYYQQLRAG